MIARNGKSGESVKYINKSYRNFAPVFVDYQLLPNLNFNGHCLINLYISYVLGRQLRNINRDFTLDNCWFGSVKLTKRADLDKYKYTRYGIGFDSRSKFLFTDGSYGKNIIIFGTDIS